MNNNINNIIECDDVNDVREIPVTKEQLRCALHELLGFVDGSNLLDQDKDRARNLPMVKWCCEIHYLYRASAKS